MADRSPFGEDTQRYWDRRHALFSRFDEGIRVDREGLFSVKPEAAALEIAAGLPGGVVLDAFCGAGGSAIAFARLGRRVVAVDADPERLEMARGNAAVYGVHDRIALVHADAADFLSGAGAGGVDAVYLDPPWGGPGYHKRPAFTLSMFSPDGNALMERALALGGRLAVTVPKNFDLDGFGGLGLPFRLRWSALDGAALFATAYFRCGRRRGRSGPVPVDGRPRRRHPKASSTQSPIARPVARPSRSENSKWMPPNTRLRPASKAASSKPRTAPGRAASLAAEKAASPKKAASTAAAAPLEAAWPDSYGASSNGLP